MQTKTKRLTESAMLLAVAIVLELVSKMLIPEFSFGGQITLASMLPVILISYRHGMKWGFVATFTYALLQMVMGAKTVSAAFLPGYFGDEVLIGKAILMCLLDYLLAFTLLGLGGAFRNRVKKPAVSLLLGIVLALTARFLAHVLSGYILFGDYAEWFFSLELFQPWGGWLLENLTGSTLGLVYSIAYNSCYMLPELVICILAALLLSRIPGIVVKKDI